MRKWTIVFFEGKKSRLWTVLNPSTNPGIENEHTPVVAIDGVLERLRMIDEKASNNNDLEQAFQDLIHELEPQ